jgi:KDO2-lipid IV(A) lauroyltransferase
MTGWFARLWIGAICLTARWPFAARARLGRFLGDLLWWLVAPRRRVALANLRACFPQWSETERRRVARACFRYVARGVLDHAVLWKGSREDVERLVRVEGAQHLLDSANRPLILVAPHFAGLDAGGLRINTLVRGVSIYARQSNAVWDDWLLAARRRFNDPVLLERGRDMRTVIRALKDGLPLYFLPDMDSGRDASIFVPFFGVMAATLPMVSRLARLTGARVITVVTEMTDAGYVQHFGAPWTDFPGASIEADTERMNREIESWVLKMPAQYLWTHKRFKTRPEGAASIY